MKRSLHSNHIAQIVSRAKIINVKSFFELLGKAMQNNGMTLRLCLLILVTPQRISSAS